MSYDTARKFDLALPLLEEALRLCTARFGPDHPQTLVAMNNLAAAYKSAEKFDLALPLQEELGRLSKATWGQDHPKTLYTLHNLAQIYAETGRRGEAFALWDQVVPKLRQVPGASHPNTLNIMAYWATALEDDRQFAKAEGIRKEILELERRRYKPGDVRLSWSLAAFGSILLKTGKSAEAEPILRELLGIGETKQPDAWTTFNTKCMLGEALLGQKKHADAEPLLLAGYDGLRQREAEIPVQFRAQRVTEALERLVALYDAWGKPDQASEWRKKLEARSGQLRESHQRVPAPSQHPRPVSPRPSAGSAG
jgi:tetratricopeptide (TPR) repeat protein